MRAKSDIDVYYTLRVIKINRGSVVLEQEDGQRHKMRADDKLTLHLQANLHLDGGG